MSGSDVLSHCYWAAYEERRKYEKVAKLVVRPPGKSAATRQSDLHADRIRDGVPAMGVPDMTRLFAMFGTPKGDVSEGFYRL